MKSNKKVHKFLIVSKLAEGLAGLPLRDAEVLGLHVQELQLEVRGRAAPVLVLERELHLDA